MGHNLLALELPLGNFNGIGPLGNFAPGEGPSVFTKILSTAIGIMTVVAIIWFVFVLLTGAIGWLSSGGDKAKLQEAQKKITNGLVGLVIVIASIFIIKIIGTIFGIDILDIAGLISNL